MKRKPNILLAIADDWAWPHAQAYGCTFVNTPNFDRVAREGVLFSNAFTTAPSCTASRASLLTGRYPWSMEAGAQLWGYLPARFQTFPNMLQDAGYFTGLTGKGWGPGDNKLSSRTRDVIGTLYQSCQCTPQTTGMWSIDYVSNFDAFLNDKPDDQPFFFWFGSLEPHRKYEKGSGLKFGKKLEDVQVPPFLPDCEEVRSDFLDYALEAERFDHDLGEMIKNLEARGELENTIIIVTGDNGMPFPRAKANIYEMGCHIPLAIRYPGMPAGRTVTDFVSFIDLAPTLLEITGTENTAEMFGRSLVNVLASTNSGRVDASRTSVITGIERHAYARPWNVGYPMRSIVTDDFVYIHNWEYTRWPAGDPGGFIDCDDSPSKTWLIENQTQESQHFNRAFGKRPEEELYRRTPDAGCLENCIKEESLQAVKQQLSEQLESVLRGINDPRVMGRGWEFDCVPYTFPSDKQTPEGYPDFDVRLWQTHPIPSGETSQFDRTGN